MIIINSELYETLVKEIKESYKFCYYNRDFVQKYQKIINNGNIEVLIYINSILFEYTNDNKYVFIQINFNENKVFKHTNDHKTIIHNIKYKSLEEIEKELKSELQTNKEETRMRFDTEKYKVGMSEIIENNGVNYIVTIYEITSEHIIFGIYHPQATNTTTLTMKLKNDIYETISHSVFVLNSQLFNKIKDTFIAKPKLVFDTENMKVGDIIRDLETNCIHEIVELDENNIIYNTYSYKSNNSSTPQELTGYICGVKLKEI